MMLIMLFTIGMIMLLMNCIVDDNIFDNDVDYCYCLLQMFLFSVHSTGDAIDGRRFR